MGLIDQVQTVDLLGDCKEAGACIEANRFSIAFFDLIEKHFGLSGPAQTIPGTLVEFWEQVEKVLLTEV